MKWLAIDTSTEIASVALLVNGTVYSQEQANQKTHAHWLLPAIDKLMVNCGVRINQLDSILFGCGPGSFTGLRVACSMAKGLAYAHDLGVIPVSSLATIAFSTRQLQANNNIPVLAVIDARMQELYWAYFDSEAIIAKESVNAVKDIKIKTEQDFILAGVGIDEYTLPMDLQDQIKAKIAVYPHAKVMIPLAKQCAIPAVTATQAEPVYVRNKVVQGESNG